MQSSPFASYPLGSIPPQASNSYLPQQQQQQQYGRSPSGYPQPNYGVGAGGAPLGMSQQQLSQQAMMMHQQQQQLAAQGMGLGGLGSLGMGGQGGSAPNLHPNQIAQLQSQFLASQLAQQQQQHSQHQQQQQGHHQQQQPQQQGGGSYGNHPMYAQQQYQLQQQQHLQQQQQQQQHHSQHSSSKDQSSSGDHHRSRSGRKSKGGESRSNPAVFNISVESEVEPIGDDLDGVTDRSLAIERYKLNHDLLGELFNPLPISKLPEPHLLPSLYTVSDLETRLAALEESNSSLAYELASQMKDAKERIDRAGQQMVIL